ncbi:hypothetical protein [Nesterenkonia marinintestina]|uniref:hypothetical protein n=1 Tax=Nesterenkonia marinintestina TaxID=2979865 RepID=UPI0021C1D2B3|nr:hypothetical protein [Nesterenkonia sp. GX14115]
MAEETRTTWMRRYTIDPELAEEFLAFLRDEVIPAREQFGFRVEQMWIDADRTQLTWFVSRAGDSAAYAAAEQEWEQSEIRGILFADKPKYALAKDLREVLPLR